VVTDGLDWLIRQRLEEAEQPPQEQADDPPRQVTPRWTLRRLVEWVWHTHQIRCCRETVRAALRRLGFSWKKWRKLLNKADPQKRAEFVEQLKPHLLAATEGREQLVYVDEAHIHLDTDEGYGWTVKGERAWISSSSPGLAKVSFYGVYLYNQGQVRILPFDCGNGDNTVEVLRQIRAMCPADSHITLLWDNVAYHHGKVVKQALRELKVGCLPLPAYSPDFMPVEHLWQWLREEVTYHTCYDTKPQLTAQVARFEADINSRLHEVADRLWVKTSLEQKVEKLRVSR
jgi:transposase